MKKFILCAMFALTACGSPILPAINQPPVVIQSQPIPVPVPNNQFHIGEIVFVRNAYGMVCRGQIVNIFNNFTYLLNPVLCNNYVYYYNITVNINALYR